MPIPVELALAAERLPAPVEAGAYYVISEALTNIVKYAHAGFARVTVDIVEPGVVVSVVDDGVGGADPSLGSGLHGLADRVAALDGELEMSSPSGGGTRVVARIPLETAPEDGERAVAPAQKAG